MQLAAYRPFESAQGAPVAAVEGLVVSAPLLRLLGAIGSGVLLLVGLLIGLLLITSGCGPPN